MAGFPSPAAIDTGCRGEAGDFFEQTLRIGRVGREDNQQPFPSACMARSAERRRRLIRTGQVA